MKQSRVSAGVPAGGEFAATAHSEPAIGLGLPISVDGISSTAQQAAMLDLVMRRGEKLGEPDPSLRVMMAANPPATPAAVLSAAVGTDKAPREIPWPEKPANSRVEVYVDPDDLAGIMDDGNWNAVTNYRQVYADIDLIANRDCDFWGIDADGNAHVIALGVHDYEEAVDPYNHENLRYREGFSNPMPAYNAAVEEVKKQRLEASTALLAEAGITVELEDLRRGHYRLSRGTEQAVHSMRLKIDDFHGSKLIETRNWREAKDEDLSALLDGPVDESARELLSLSATLVARDLQGKAYKETHGR